MKLSVRRFPDTITRKRQAPGTRNRFGEFVPGEVTTTELRASIQPISLEDEDVLEGERLLERLKVYVPEPDALIAAFGDRQADKVDVDGGVDFVVEQSKSWRGSHTRAILLRGEQ